jgi:DHA1 family tetracycline resistance protein-like MFS transporter
MSSSSARAPAVPFIFVTLVLAIVGMGLLIPVLPKLVVQMRGGDFAEGSHAYGAVVVVYALMQFIASPILGSLSDRYGRRRVILLATAGSTIDYVIMALAPNLVWLFVARMIAGFTAGIMATSNAYIVDVTPPEKRAGAFGLMGAAFGVGFILGPALGGFLGNIDLRLPFWFAAGCSFVNLCWGFFVLPESLKPENRREFSWARANPIGSLAALLRFPAVFGLAGSFFLLNCAQMMLYSIWALYTGYRYQWGPQEVGLSLMAVGLLSGVVQAVVVRKLVPILGDTRAVVIGFAVSLVTNIGYGFAAHGWMIYALMAFGSFAGLAGPALQSYITKHVPANEQGAVQGVFSGLASLAGIPGPIIATWAFGWAVEQKGALHQPGLPFFLGALLTLGALLLAVRSFQRDAHTTPAT